MRIAIIGTGISGSLVARILSVKHEVTVFESNTYPGGHANTVDTQAFGNTYSVDTGFMVFNDRTYPNFCRLLDLLDIESQPSDMSFSVHCSKTGLQYQGSSFNGLFAQRRNLVSPSFLKLLADIVRFNRQGNAAAASGVLKDGRSVSDFLEECSVGQRFIDQYLVPMAAAIWSSKPRDILAFPAEFMIGFFANHGLMQISDRPQWRTIVGGSRKYLAALLGSLSDRVRLGCPIGSVTRGEDSVSVSPVDGEPVSFDHVVFASHADQTIQMMTDPTNSELEILSAFPYQTNEAVLHTDTSLLPSRDRAWASWNYHIPRGQDKGASLTYDLSRLQSHHTPSPILLTLNESDMIDPTSVLRTFVYEHPAYSRESIAAQTRHSEISGVDRIHYCGAYWGYGFHEDGVNSALAVASHFGLGLEDIGGAATR